MPHLQGSSVSYRIAVCPQQGQKAFMICTIRPFDRPNPGLERVAKANGFSLHTGGSCEGRERNKRERLCRYIARPAVANPRLSLSSTGKVVYTLKTRSMAAMPLISIFCFPVVGFYRASDADVKKLSKTLQFRGLSSWCAIAVSLRKPRTEDHPERCQAHTKARLRYRGSYIRRHTRAAELVSHGAGAAEAAAQQDVIPDKSRALDRILAQLRE